METMSDHEELLQSGCWTLSCIAFATNGGSIDPWYYYDSGHYPALHLLSASYIYGITVTLDTVLHRI